MAVSAPRHFNASKTHGSNSELGDKSPFADCLMMKNLRECSVAGQLSTQPNDSMNEVDEDFC